MVKKDNPKNITFNLGNDMPVEGEGIKKKRRGRPKKVQEVIIKEKLPHQKFSHKTNRALDQLLEAKRDKEKADLEKGLRALTGVGVNADKFFGRPKIDRSYKDPELPSGSQRVPLPFFGDLELEIPPFFVVPTKKGWKLANPLTEIRNLATRKGQGKAISIVRKNTDGAVLKDGGAHEPRLDDFSGKDQRRIIKYFDDIRKGQNKETEYETKNKPRGFPAVLYKNAKKAGYKETKEKVYRKNELKPRPKAQYKIPVGRPSQYRRIQIEGDSDDEEDSGSDKEPTTEQQRIAQRQKKAREKRQGSVKTAEYWDKWLEDLKSQEERQVKYYTANYGTSSEGTRKDIQKTFDETRKSLSQGDKKIADERIKPRVAELIANIVKVSSREYRDMREKQQQDKNKADEKKVEDWKTEVSTLTAELKRKPLKPRRKEIHARLLELRADRETWKDRWDWGATTKQLLNDFIDAYNAVKGTGFSVMKGEGDCVDRGDSAEGGGSDGEHEGDGLLGDIGKKAYNALIKPKVEKVKKTIHQITHPKETFEKAKQMGKDIIYGRMDYPPSVRTILDKYGDDEVVDIDLHRKVLSVAYTGLLNVLTEGEFNKRVAEQPKDKLFHISMWVKLKSGTTILVEKNEVISMKVSPKANKEEEQQPVDITPPAGLKFAEMFEKALKQVGEHKFFSYSAKDNNCGNFIEYILRANGMESQATKDFIGQDAKAILEGFPKIRKFMNTLTDIAGRANVVLEGGEIFSSDSDSDSDMDICSCCGSNNCCCGGGLERRYNVNNVASRKKLSHTNYIMPTQGGRMIGLARPAVLPAHIGHPALVSDQYPRIPQAFTQVHLAHPIPIGHGLYSGGGLGMGMYAPVHMIGGDKGIRHMGGDGIFDDIGRALDPKRNGVAKALDPKQNGVSNAFNKTFTPQLGRDITSGLIHKALPAVISGVAGSATTALTGNPYAGFAVGQTLGKYAGKEAGDALGKATGYGLGCGMKKGRLVKGSAEAKAYMASIRKRKGSKGGDLPPRSRGVITDPSLL